MVVSRTFPVFRSRIKTMSMTDIKRIASDCRNVHRWAVVTTPSGQERQLRVISVGSKYITTMGYDGILTAYTADAVIRVW